MEAKEDIQGQALLDYFIGKEEVELVLYTSYGPPEEMPVEIFFRDKRDFSTLEKLALKYCRGKVLDIGAGGGSFALELQKMRLGVIALELSPLSCQLMRRRGVVHVEEGDIWEYEEGGFNTLLLMMNGLGLAGKLENLPGLLSRLKERMLPEGQIICDSSDISYLYAGGKKPEDRYYGEIEYCYEYEGKQGDWFGWLYVDPVSLASIAESVGMKVEVLYRNRKDQYLARITMA